MGPINHIAVRYAKALLQRAVAVHVLMHVYEDMHGFDALCTSHKNMVDALNHPFLSKHQKIVLLQTIFQDKFQPLTLDFFAMVIRKSRVALLTSMVKAFFALYDRYQSIKTAHVTTVCPLSKALVSQVQQIAQQITPCRKMNVVQYLDPTLIGGYVLQIEDKRFDQSLRKQLHVLLESCTTAMP